MLGGSEDIVSQLDEILRLITGNQLITGRKIITGRQIIQSEKTPSPVGFTDE
jgi:hypothetical protein